MSDKNGGNHFLPSITLKDKKQMPRSDAQPSAANPITLHPVIKAVIMTLFVIILLLFPLIAQSGQVA